jgi:hemolysin activation/secretion protein
VLEAMLGAVTVDPSSPARLDGELAAGLAGTRAEIGQPLHPSELQEGMAILNEVPGIAATAVLRPGAAPGQTVADIRLADRPWLSGWIQADNAGVSASGERRGLADAALDDLLGRGERLSVLAVKTADSTYGRAALQMPAGTSGLSLGIDGSGLTYSLGGPFSALGETGSAYTVGATAAYPIRRTPSFSLSAYGTFDYKRLVTRALPGTINDRIVIAGTAGLAANLSDEWFGGASDTLGAAVTAGNLDRSPNADDLEADRATARSNGRYAKLSVNAARLQPLGEGVALSLSAEGQAALGNLDSSEQFSLGGPAGIRAYPVNEANGDDGIVATAEPRWAPVEGVVLSAFYDIGVIRQHAHPYPGSQLVPGQPNAYPLQGAGVGIDWLPLPEIELKAVYAHAVGLNAGHDAQGANSDGKHDRDALWLQAKVAF